jgi:hypothetical protein
MPVATESVNLRATTAKPKALVFDRIGIQANVMLLGYLSWPVNCQHKGKSKRRSPTANLTKTLY